MSDNKVSTIDSIVDLHLTKGAHWNWCFDKESIASYGCPPPKLLSDFLLKEIENVFF